MVDEEKKNVKLLDDVVIPANSHVIAFAKIIENIPKTEYTMLEAGFAERRYGIHIPPTIVTTDKNIPVCVYNNDSHPIKLRKGASIGTAAPASLDHLEQQNLVTMESDESPHGASPDGHPLPLIDLTHLEGDEKSQVEKLLLKYHAVFARNEDDIGRCPLTAPPVRMKEGGKIVCEPPRRYNNNQMQELIKQTGEMERKGIIKKSYNSPWRSFPVLAAKKDEQGNILAYKRFCIDLRSVNEQLDDGDAYSTPLPRACDIFDSVAQSLDGAGDEARFSKLDVKEAFFNLPLEEDSKQYFSFYTPLGNYVWNFTPYGYKGSPAAFNVKFCLEGTPLEECICFCRRHAHHRKIFF